MLHVFLLLFPTPATAKFFFTYMILRTFMTIPLRFLITQPGVWQAWIRWVKRIRVYCLRQTSVCGAPLSSGHGSNPSTTGAREHLVCVSVLVVVGGNECAP